MDNWLLLHTKYHKEDFLASEIESRSIVCYCPRLQVQPNNPRARKTRPFFPGYIFVKLEPGNQMTNELKWFPGVLNWVNFGSDPAMVSDFIVNNIRKHVNTLNSARRDSRREITKGSSIQVIDGAFMGYKGVFESHLLDSERVVVLLQLIHSQQKRVEMPLNLIRIEKHSQLSMSC
jgi:transcriptional antiterminator RfaH